MEVSSLFVTRVCHSQHTTVVCWGGASISINRVQATAASVRSCLAVRRNNSHRIPDESGEDSEDIL
jgi:hypothetical protein